MDKEFVSRRVTQAVIEYLEFVDVDEQYREFEIAVALRNLDRPLQAIEKERPVWKIGQTIVKGAMLHLRLGMLPFSNVTVDGDQPF